MVISDYVKGTVNHDDEEKKSCKIPHYLQVLDYIDLNITTGILHNLTKVVKFSYFHIFGNKILLGLCTR